MSGRVRFVLRVANAVASLVVLVLLLAHAVSGGFMLLGVNGATAKPLSWAAFAAAAFHAAVGLFFTVETLCNARGRSYARLNARFWAVRASGAAVLLLLLFHIGGFGVVRSGQFVLFRFTTVKLVAHMLLTSALAVHVISALRPTLVALGFRRGLDFDPALLMFLAVLLLFFASAFVMYFFMWL